MSAPIDAVILCGGEGKRLQPLVADRPKSMADVAGKPFLQWLLESLAGPLVARFILCTGYMGTEIAQHFQRGNACGKPIIFSHEATPLGTGGAVLNALPLVASDPFLLLNGDTFFNLDLGALLQFHQDSRLNSQPNSQPNSQFNKAALVTMALVAVPHCQRYGSVVVDSHGAVLAFREKDPQRGDQPGLINAGAYLMQKSLWQDGALRPPSASFSLEYEVLPRLIQKGLFGLEGPQQTDFSDIGTPESYLSFKELRKGVSL